MNDNRGTILDIYRDALDAAPLWVEILVWAAAALLLIGLAVVLIFLIATYPKVGVPLLVTGSCLFVGALVASMRRLG